jgi:hypothetical protein
VAVTQLGRQVAADLIVAPVVGGESAWARSDR